MGLKTSLKYLGRKAAKGMLMAAMVVSATMPTYSMQEKKAPEPTEQKAHAPQEVPVVDEAYTIKEMTIRYDDNSGDFIIEKLVGWDDGKHTGTGRPTNMRVGFYADPGAPPSDQYNSTGVRVDTFNVDYNDVEYNQSAIHIIDIDMTLEPNGVGTTKSRSVFTVVGASDASNSDDPFASGQNASNVFQVKKMRFKGKSVPVKILDMQGNPLRNIRSAARDIVINTGGYSPKALTAQIRFFENGVMSPLPNAQRDSRRPEKLWGYARNTAFGDGTQQTDYFKEEVYLTGPKYQKP